MCKISYCHHLACDFSCIWSSVQHSTHILVTQVLGIEGDQPTTKLLKRERVYYKAKEKELLKITLMWLDDMLLPFLMS